MAQSLAFGVTTGGFLLLAALGFQLVMRVEKFLNLAHAQLISVSALLTWGLTVSFSLPFLLGAGIAVLITTILGLLIARICYQPLRRHGPVVLFIASMGVVFVLQAVVDGILPAGVYDYDLPLPLKLNLGSITLTSHHMYVLATAVIAFVALHLWLTRTSAGIRIRAVAEDRELARLRHIDVTSVTRQVWMIASALAGIAGVALGTLGSLTEDIGFQQILLVIAVSIFAGLGSIYGAAIAALLLGILMDLSTVWLGGSYREAVAFVVILIVLLFRPQGMAGEARE